MSGGVAEPAKETDDAVVTRQLNNDWVAREKVGIHPEDESEQLLALIEAECHRRQLLEIVTSQIPEGFQGLLQLCSNGSTSWKGPDSVRPN